MIIGGIETTALPCHTNLLDSGVGHCVSYGSVESSQTQIHLKHYNGRPQAAFLKAGSGEDFIHHVAGHNPANSRAARFRSGEIP